MIYYQGKSPDYVKQTQGYLERSDVAEATCGTQLIRELFIFVSTMYTTTLPTHIYMVLLPLTSWLHAASIHLFMPHIFLRPPSYLKPSWFTVLSITSTITTSAIKNHR